MQKKIRQIEEILESMKRQSDIDDIPVEEFPLVQPRIQRVFERDARPFTTRTPVDYSGFDFPQEDVAVEDKVALMLEEDNMLHWVGTGRVSRPLTNNEFTHIKNKRDYFMVVVLTVEKEYVDYNAPFVTSTLEPGVSVPWRRSKLFVLKDFLSITTSARQPQPNEYHDVLQSQPKATRKRKRIEIHEPELEEVDPVPKKSKVAQDPDVEIEVGHDSAELSYSQLQVKVKGALDHMLPLMTKLRNFCDLATTTTTDNSKQESNELIVGSRKYYPTNDEWARLNRGQPIVVLKQLMLLCATQLQLDFQQNSYILPGTRSKELLVGKVKLNRNQIAQIREAAEKYCPVYSKVKLNNRDKFMKRLGIALHELHMKRQTENRVKSERIAEFR